MSTGPQSNLAPPAGHTASDEVFNDNFSSTTLDKDWHDVARPRDARQWNFLSSTSACEGE
jgi:hypothetical protein